MKRWRREALTFREHQILFGFCGGLLPPQIAQVLGLSTQTVKVALSRIRGKRGLLWTGRVETVVNLNAALKDAFYRVPVPVLDLVGSATEGAD